MPLPSLSDLSAVPSQRDVVLDAQRHVSADDLYTWYENNHGFPAGSGNDIVHSGWYNLMKILADSGGSMEYSNTNVLQAAGTNGITLDSTETINDIIESMCNPPNVDQLTLQQLCKVLAEAIHNVLKISGYKNAYYQKRLSMYDDFPPEFGFPAAEVLTTKRFKPKHRKQLMKAKLAATRVKGPVEKEPDYYLYEAQVEGNAAQGGTQIRSSLV